MKKFIKFLSLLVIMMTLATACTTSVDTSTEGNKVEENKPILLNSIFKIEMPSRFDGLYDTIVKDNAIDFYDLECKQDGYEGWAFGVYAYENPADWAGGPIEKVGELKISNEKTYDIVIAYPTESQFGFDREMPAKYKDLYDARYEIVGNVVALSGEKISVGEGTKGESLYREQMNKHLTSLNEKWDSTHLENENMSPIYAIMADGNEDVLKKVGFAYKDINLDGIDELLVGEIADGEWNGIIYDLYTMVDRKPMHVFSGWDRNRYYLMESGFILNEASEGAGSSESNFYTLTSNSTELFFQFGCKYDEYENKDNPWFITYDSNEENRNWENSTEEKVNEMQNRLSRLTFDYTPFANVK